MKKWQFILIFSVLLSSWNIVFSQESHNHDKSNNQNQSIDSRKDDSKIDKNTTKSNQTQNGKQRPQEKNDKSRNEDQTISKEVDKLRKGINKSLNQNSNKSKKFGLSDIPNPRVSNASWVSDPSGYFTTSERNQMNSMISALEKQTTAEIAVVIVPNIGSPNFENFVNALFNNWGIGKKNKDNGLMIFVAVNIHKWRIEVGYGLEGIIPDNKAKHIGEDFLTPNFKNEEYGKGVIEALEVITKVLKDPENAEEIYDEELSSDFYRSYRDSVFSAGFFTVYFWILGIFFASFILVFMLHLVVGTPHKKYHMLKFYTPIIWSVVFPIPFLPFRFLILKRMKAIREIPPKSKNGNKLYKLSESEEDQFLEPGQISEDNAKSIDYDVWISEGATEVIVLRYPKWFSKYSKCPQCSNKTKYLAGNRTITSATCYSSGTGEKDYACKHCSYKRTVRYTIPRRSCGDSSSSSGGSSSSFGGGSSGGGGASGSW